MHLGLLHFLKLEKTHFPLIESSIWSLLATSFSCTRLGKPAEKKLVYEVADLSMLSLQKVPKEKDKNQGEQNRKVENFPPLKEKKRPSKSFFCFTVKSLLHIPTPSASPAETNKKLPLSTKRSVFILQAFAEHKYLVK